MNKRILKIVALALIQMFWVGDVLPAGPLRQVEAKKVKHRAGMVECKQTRALSPKLLIDNNQVKQVYSAFRKEQLVFRQRMFIGKSEQTSTLIKSYLISYANLSSNIVVIHRDTLHSMLKRLLNPRETIIHSHLSMVDLMAFIETQIFIDTCMESISKKEGKYFYFLPEEKILAYFDDYLNSLLQIEGLVKNKFNVEKLDTLNVFMLLQKTTMMLEKVRNRYYDFLRDYRSVLKPIFDEKGVFDLDVNTDAEELFVKHPDLKYVFDWSFAIYYRDLFKIQTRLKNALGERLKKTPRIIKEVINYLHNSPDEISDDSVNWLMNLQVEKAESTIRAREQLKKVYGDEHFIYEGTPYGRIRELTKILDLQPNDVFYDLGSGYGHLVFYLGLVTRAGKIKGIELLFERVSESNLVKDRLALNNCEFICGNVVDLDFSDGTVFFVFESFSEDTWKKTVSKLKKIALRKKIKIVVTGNCVRYLRKQSNWLIEKEIVYSDRSTFGDIFIFQSKENDSLAPGKLNNISVKELDNMTTVEQAI